jgi:hypothetical protein
MKPAFLLEADLRGITNCNTFSVVPSIINGNVKNALLHLNMMAKDEKVNIKVICLCGAGEK